MNKEIKKKWMNALRSGEYKQTTLVLRDNDGFCCLGVLCDLHSKEIGTSWVENEKNQFYGKVNQFYRYKDRSSELPSEVLKWADLPLDYPTVKTSKGFLADLNDSGTSFYTIADIIEKDL